MSLNDFNVCDKKAAIKQRDGVESGGGRSVAVIYGYSTGRLVSVNYQLSQGALSGQADSVSLLPYVSSVATPWSLSPTS